MIHLIIGKRNDILNIETNLIAEYILQKKDKASQWIAKNYMMELGIKRMIKSIPVKQRIRE